MPEHAIHLKNGKLTGDTPGQAVREIVRAALAHPGDRGILLHFHGGLVSEAAGRAAADRLLPVYGSSGVYPVFFVWESGLLETVANNLGEISRERLFRLLWSRVANVVGRKLKQDQGSRGGQILPEEDPGELEAAIARALDESAPEALPGEVPAVDGLGYLTDFERATLEEDLSADFALVSEIQRVSNALLTPAEAADEAAGRGPGALALGSSLTLMDADALDRLVERPAPGSRGIVSTARMIKAIVGIAARVITRFVKSRDHGLHATVVEEILRELYVARVGGKVWSLMKGDTRDAFGNDPGVCGGSAFLEELKLQAGDPPPRITLVGHSTGAVFICELLERADAVLGEAFTFDVVFLAPAVTCARFQKVLQDQPGRIRSFRMFTMKDDRERADVLVRVLYPHSLLYFVAGVVEDEPDMPLVGMQRYLSPGDYPARDFPSVEAVRAFLAEPGRVCWSVAREGAGKNTTAIRHGDFDNDAATLDSIDHLLRTGWT